MTLLGPAGIKYQCEIGKGAHHAETSVNLFCYHHMSQPVPVPVSTGTELSREVKREQITSNESRGKNHPHSQHFATSEILLNPSKAVSWGQGQGKSTARLHITTVTPEHGLVYAKKP